MAFLIYSDELTKFGYLPQTVWGTAIADDGLFREIKCPKGIFVNPNIHLVDLDLNRASRIQDLADVYIDAVGGTPMLTIPEMLVSRARAADFPCNGTILIACRCCRSDARKWNWKCAIIMWATRSRAGPARSIC